MSPASSDAPVELSRELPEDASAARTARRLLVEQLAGWGCEDLTDAAALAVTELVTNALLHARPPYHLHLRWQAPRLRVEVRDSSRTPAIASKTIAGLDEVDPEQQRERLSGRGLLIVAGLARAVGESSAPGGKAVWFELDARDIGQPSGLATIVQERLLAEEEDGVEITVTDLDIDVALASAAQTDDLLRELFFQGGELSAELRRHLERLGGSFPLPRDAMEAVRAAAARGHRTTTVAFRFDPALADALRSAADVFDRAEATFAEREIETVLPTPAIRAHRARCVEAMLGERAQAPVASLFTTGGDVGRDLSAVDWAATSLGPPDAWPQSLLTAVRIVLTSRFSMWMGWGPDLTFFCNDAYRRDTLGTKYPWALGRPVSEVWAEIWPDIAPRVDRVISSGESTWDEGLLLFVERSGYVEETYHTFSYSPLSGDDGSIAGMLCVVSEDTERVIAERRIMTVRNLGAELSSVHTEAEVLAVASEQLAADPRSLPFTLLYLFDAAGATARLVGGSGMPPGHPSAPAELDATAADERWPANVLARREPVLVELDDSHGELPTGAWHEPPVNAFLVPLLQRGHDLPYGFLVAGLNRFRPVDEDYRGFIQLVAGQLAASLGTARAYEAERHRAERLAELDQAKTAFFTNVSHEFRTPLTLLLGPAEDALADLDHPLPDEQRHRLDVVRRNGDRLLHLVNTLLDFSRLESGRLQVRFERTDLSAYTTDLASMFRSAFDRAGLTLTVDAGTVDEPVYVDREMWAKIVLNLLSNALKFTFEGGVGVTVAGAPGAVELRVADTGIGIAALDQERLFERFHRVEGARSRTYEGSGIGLALVAELAELHGGSAEVRSEPGDGTTFTVRIPTGAGHLDEASVVEHAGQDVPLEHHAAGFLAEAARWLGDDDDERGGQPAPAASRTRVLVVDDNADMRDYVARILADDYAVDTAPDGAVALELARSARPDLIITDVMMPNLDGFGLLRALRAEPATHEIPVVMLSARAGEDGVIEGLEAGADDYLSKPFAARELLARVRANLELDRARRVRDELERSRGLLDQAQRLAGVGSWEMDLRTGDIAGSDEFMRQLQIGPEHLAAATFREAFSTRCHPDDLERVGQALAAAADGAPLDYEVRLAMPDGSQRTFRTIGVLERDADGAPARLRGSNQDITDQRAAQQAVAAVLAAREASEREHQIAEELQRSLLPDRRFDPEHLDVATFYRAGVEGTQVGGDWYDVIELGAGRSALVLGDVMGRGVRAAAVMGQLRSAIRAYARLDLPPVDVLEFLDGVVRELGDDHIVTCVYAVYDPADRTLAYANAGHLPPVLTLPGEAPTLLEVAGPPLGTGPLTLVQGRVELPPGAVLVLYTDGLVERRGEDLQTGLDALLVELARPVEDIDRLPAALVAAVLPGPSDDDIAVLAARVSESASATVADHRIGSDHDAVHRARVFTADTVRAWGVDDERADDVVLLASELVTNAVLHGRAPMNLRVRRSAVQLVLEVEDSATFLPRRLRPTAEDEQGRGLQIVSLLADRWGTRPTETGKVVWCIFDLPGEGRAAER